MLANLETLPGVGLTSAGGGDELCSISVQQRKVVVLVYACECVPAWVGMQDAEMPLNYPCIL